MAVKLSPIWTGEQFFNAAGQPLSGGKINTYLAGTTTAQATFTDATGVTPNANPIILDSTGRYSAQIWLTVGLAYKFVLTDSNNNTIATEDNLSGINDTSSGVTSEWLPQSTPTFVSGTSFTVTGNQTSTFQVGRRVQATINSGFIYGTIATSVFTSLTTVTVTNDSGALDATLSAVSVGLLGETNPSVPARISYSLALGTITGTAADGTPSIQGSNTNDSASAGFIGETITGTTGGVAVSLTSPNPSNVTSVSLTSGDWDVNGNVLYSFSVGMTSSRFGFSTTSATLPAANEDRAGLDTTATVTVTGGPAPTKRFSLSSTTTVYLVANATFGSGTGSVFGQIIARRRR